MSVASFALILIIADASVSIDDLYLSGVQQHLKHCIKMQ